jgi:hypothetical protein
MPSTQTERLTNPYPSYLPDEEVSIPVIAAIAVAEYTAYHKEGFHNQRRLQRHALEQGGAERNVWKTWPNFRIYAVHVTAGVAKVAMECSHVEHRFTISPQEPPAREWLEKVLGRFLKIDFADAGELELASAAHNALNTTIFMQPEELTQLKKLISQNQGSEV